MNDCRAQLSYKVCIVIGLGNNCVAHAYVVTTLGISSNTSARLEQLQSMRTTDGVHLMNDSYGNLVSKCIVGLNNLCAKAETPRLLQAHERAVILERL